MNTQSVAASVVALLIGLGGGYLVWGIDTPSDINMHAAMTGMTSGLEGKTDDEFDKAFLAEMIVHHQGAVDMAEAALGSAKHEELKDMAHAIITAQTSEIAQMQEWQRIWYGK